MQLLTQWMWRRRRPSAMGRAMRGTTTSRTQCAYATKWPQHAVYTQPRRPAPDVRLSTTNVYAGTATPRATWHRARKEPLPLTRGQYEAYELLKHAGERQLLTFLSGEGGVGKSTLIKLLIAY